MEGWFIISMFIYYCLLKTLEFKNCKLTSINAMKQIYLIICLMQDASLNIQCMCLILITIHFILCETNSILKFFCMLNKYN